MSSSVLVTKLFIPPAPTHLVKRNRLVERLNLGMQRKLTLVSAPAGYGKTTLLTDWVTQCSLHKYPIVWISLDKQDNQSQRFWTTILEGLKDAFAPALEGVKLEFGDEQPFLEEPFTNLINAIASKIHPDFSLILDDYHHITQQHIHEALSFFIANLPDKMHLVISTRYDPPLSLAHLRACDQLVELRTSDLRFTHSEEIEFMRATTGLELLSEALSLLEKRTEGWAAALQMAALSMRDREDPLTIINSFSGSHRFIVDYLAEQVLDHQTPTVRQFLLTTSILERLSAGLCEALCPEVQGQAMLESLEQANLFLIPLDGNRHWYRYHSLFASFLRNHLQMNQPQLLPHLHNQASQWYQDQDMLDEAIHHALEAGNYARATGLIEMELGSLRARGEWLKLLNWIKNIPENLVLSQPLMCLAHASALATNGQVDSAEIYLDAVEKTGHSPDQTTSQTARVIARNLRGFVAGLRGNYQDAIRYCQEAEELIPKHNLRAKGLVLLFSGIAYLQSGEFSWADRNLSQACINLRKVDHKVAYIRATHYLGQLRMHQGRLDDALALFDLAIDYTQQENNALFAGIEHIDKADVLREMDDLQGAFWSIHEGLQQVEKSGDYVFLRDAYQACARFEQALGNLDEALYYLHKAEHLASLRHLLHDRELICARRVWIWLEKGNLAEAQRWANSCGLRSNGSYEFANEFRYLTLIRVLIAQGEAQRANRMIHKLLASALAERRIGSLILIYTLQALAFRSMGDTKGAQEAFKQSLLLAEPSGYIHSIVDLGSEIEPLLEQAKANKFGSYAGYATKLLNILDRRKKAISAGELDSSPTELLSKRECQVLKLIAAGRSYQEIACELVIALSTVQTHIRNIYVKLDVHSGIEAVNRARQLNLLP
jgi:LuxR family transcriptional regulator, maltose regulon positive regulatory protein